jgi:hypothetical protein
VVAGGSFAQKIQAFGTIIVVLIVMIARRYDTSYFPNPDDYDVSYYDIFDCDDPQDPQFRLEMGKKSQLS